jgi:hypothetical protein
LPLHTKPLHISEKGSSTLDVEQPILIQEHNLIDNESSTDRKNTQVPSDIKPIRRHSTQNVEQSQNVQLSEPSIHESVSDLNTSETEIIDKISNYNIQEDGFGVNVPLDLGTTSVEQEKV